MATSWWCYALFIFLLGATSCVKNQISDISGNVDLRQSLSVPLGAKTETIPTPSTADTSSIPGRYGKFYYNDLPYPIDSPYFVINDIVALNLISKTNTDQIWSVTFSIVLSNSYPTQASVQISLLDANGNFLDRVFENGPQNIDAAETDANGNLIKPSIKIIESVYEDIRLDLLKRARYLNYQVSISTSSSKTIRLSDKNNFIIDIGTRIGLAYNIKDLSH